MNLSFASPAWLFGLMALAIPIALHLWSRRPSQLVRLGSLDLLQGVPGPRAWGRQLDDLPLLAIRISVLASCILGLAGPHWQSAGSVLRGPQLLVVADPALVADSLAFFSDPLVDSLRRSETPIRLMQAGFPILGSGGTAPDTPRSTFWSLLNEWDAEAPPGSSILVVARPPAGSMGAVRPSLASAVRWHSPAAPSEELRVAISWVGPQDSVVRVLEQAEENRLRQSYDLIAAGQVVPNDMLLRQAGSNGIAGRLTRRSGIFDGAQVVAGEADTAVSRTVTAALFAALTGTQGFAPPLTEVSAGSAAEAGAAHQLVIWLNGQSVSDPYIDMIANGHWVIEFVPIDSALRYPAGGGQHLAKLGQTAPPWTSPLAIRAAEVALREDAVGRPWATASSYRSGRWYRIGINQDAVGSMRGDPVLPELFHEILASGSPASLGAVSASQALPGKRPAGAAPVSAGSSFAQPLLLLAALLLAGERLLAQARHRPAR